MPTTPSQAIIDTGADATLSVYATNLQSVPTVTGANIYITNKQEYVTNIISENAAGGSDEEVQFNIGGRVVGDSGLTYDMETNSLTVAGNIAVGYIRTDNILHSNGVPYVFSGTYDDTNVYTYLNSGTFAGNIGANNFSANTYTGNAAGLRSLTGANVTGIVANAAYATLSGSASAISAANISGTVANATYAASAGTAGSSATAVTVTQGAQSNITSVGTLTGLTVSGTINGNVSGNLSGNVTGNVTGSVSGNVSGSAATVTTNAQPNITSVGTLTGLTVTATIAGNVTGSAASAGTVTTNAQPNITSVGTLANLTVGSSAPIHLYANGLANITSTTASINTTSGALKVAGGLGVVGNIHSESLHALGNVYADIGFFGVDAQGTSFTNPVIFAKSTGTDYIQAAIQNSTDTGSSDFTAYGENGDEGTAWVDLGFTGSNFSDPTYTITGKNDGYVFVQGSGGLGGNLVLATGNLGYTVHRDIIFATGGFLSNNERMRLNHESLSLDISTEQDAANTTSGSLRVGGGAGITGNLHVGGLAFANTITLSGTGTAVDTGSGNILTNQVSGTYFNFRNGGFTARLTATSSAVANYTLTLPVDTGTSGQVLSTDGNGILSWTATPVVWTTAPVSNIATGSAGQAAYDSGGNLYVCVATNTWSKFTGTLSW